VLDFMKIYILLFGVVFMEGRGRQCILARLMLYCMTVCISVLGVECITYVIDLLMEGTGRECSVAWLAFYCETLYILVFGVECVTVSNVVFMEGTVR